MSITSYEYAIVDQNGKFFGLPVKTWESSEAVWVAYDEFMARRNEMEEEAAVAHARLARHLATVCDDAQRAEDFIPLRERESLQDTINRWDAERQRVWAVVEREVSLWRTITVTT